MLAFNRLLPPGLGALAIVLAAGCATQRGPEVDPIFQAVPGGQYACANASDQRNVAVKSATSTAGQAAIGGAAGGLLGNQFGRGTGRDIATGVGAAAGLAAGAWNARRMGDNRYRHCLQQQQSGNAYRYAN